MRLRGYLEDVLGTGVKIKVLRTLFSYPSKTFTIRELAESSNGVTHTGVRKALVNLIRSNLVNVEHHGQSNLVSLNRKNRLYRELSTLFGNESGSFSRFREDLAAGIPGCVVSCAIFGSVARASEKLDSDVDALFIADENVRDCRERIMDFLEVKSQKIIDEYGKVIIPYIMTRREFVRKRGAPFVKGILKNYAMVNGEDLWKLTQ